MPTKTQISGLFRSPVPFYRILDEIPLGVSVIDSSRKILYINKMFCALTGFSCDEAMGVPCGHILRSQACMKDCPALGLGPGSDTSVCKTDIINRSREKIPIRISVGPITDESGSLVGFLETIEDLRPSESASGVLDGPFAFSGIIGKSKVMEDIFRMIPFVAQTDSSVLITGETGTGKDLVAEAIHAASPRAKGPFIKINCGALPETLLESELFGHKKGAFTGAIQDKPGRFRLAHNGTVYLTEIGDLPLSLQVKLLTFLDDRVIHPLGSTKGFAADVRVIAGTHRNLEEMAEKGLFRKDLLFRLNVVRLHLPPLRDRGEDIRLLMDHFLRLFSRRFGKRVEGFEAGAVSVLTAYPYPGNVRELRNIIEYAVNVCTGGKIKQQDLPVYLSRDTGRLTGPEKSSTRISDASLGSFAYSGAVSWPETEKAMIIDALRRAGGKKGKAARLLGWGRSTLWRKMKIHKIN